MPNDGPERDSDTAVMYSCAACGRIFFRVTDVWMPGVTGRDAEAVKCMMIGMEVGYRELHELPALA